MDGGTSGLCFFFLFLIHIWSVFEDNALIKMKLNPFRWKWGHPFLEFACSGGGEKN